MPAYFTLPVTLDISYYIRDTHSCPDLYKAATYVVHELRN